MATYQPNQIILYEAQSSLETIRNNCTTNSLNQKSSQGAGSNLFERDQAIIQTAEVQAKKVSL